MPDYREYLVTLRVRTPDNTPAEWDWNDILEQDVTLEICTPTNRIFVYDEDAGGLVEVDFVQEPHRLQGSFVNVCWNNGRGIVSEQGTILAVSDTEIQLMPAFIGSAIRGIPQSAIRTLTPATKAVKK